MQKGKQGVVVVAAVRIAAVSNAPNISDGLVREKAKRNLKKINQGILVAVVTLAALIASSGHAPAIEGLKISIHCPDVWLSWPSVENGETYIVQYRQTLDTNSSWISLTNYMPADGGTNLTIFVHSNQVSCPSGQTYGNSAMSVDGDSGGLVPYGSTTLMATAKDGTGAAVPLICYPPGFDITTLFLFETNTTIWLPQGAEYNRPGDVPGPPGVDGGDGPLTNGMSVTSGFYRVVRDGAHFFGLTNETTLSDTVRLPVEAGYLDGDPLETVTLSVNGLPVDDIFPVSQPFLDNIYFTLDTKRLANGPCYLQVGGIWRVAHTNTYESPTVQINGVNGDSVLVYITNNICYPNWVTDVGETNMLVKISSLYTNINWRVDIYGAVGDHIGSFTNHSDDGMIDFAWDLRDTNGVAREDLIFSTVTTVNDLDSAATAVSTNPPAVRRIDNYPSQARWLVARADIIPHDFTHFDLFTNAINAIAQMGEQAGGVRPLTDRNFGEAYLVHLASVTNWARMLFAMTNLVRNFYWFGHGTPNTITDGERSLSSDFVADFLNNIAPGTNNTRYRFVWMDGCSTALGSWPAAFGLGTREDVPLTSYSTRPGVFAGYTQNVYGYGGHTSVTTVACYYRSDFVFYWSLLGEGVKDAFDDAKQSSTFSQAQYLKLYGYWDLHWQEFNQKQDWP